MGKKLYCICTFICFFAVVSCKKTNQNLVFDESIKVRMNEVVDSVKRTLVFFCYTEKIFECSNYSIESNYTLKGDKITINFIKIIKPNICLTSLGPASISINFNELKNQLYELELNFGANKVVGQLYVTSESFVATVPTQTNIQFVNPDLKRVPKNIIYGTVHYNTASTSYIVQEFLDSLQFYGAVPGVYATGDYGQFQIDTNGQIKQNPDLGYFFTRYYIFNYSNTSQRLKDLVRRFGINYPDLILVTLNTAKGETFYSWVK